MKPRILVVDDDAAYRVSMIALLGDLYDVIGAADGQEAVDRLADPFDLIVMDVRMPGIQGVDLVEVLRARGEGAPILMISGFGTVETAVRALHVGADDFLTKPVEPELLLERVGRLLRNRPLLGEQSRRLVGRSSAMQRVQSEIDQVAPTEATVLITGETGTGKELVARSIHEGSSRRDRPFVTVNSAGLAETLIESQLFGHIRGAFTGADRDRDGLFAAAHGGTLFLDEVGDMSMSAQKRLLRVLQEGEVLPVGAVEPRRVDVRVLAATHKDLPAEIEAGRFRADLFYRLNVFPVALPPLRERIEDLPLLVEYVIDGEGGARISPGVMDRLAHHAWPGNVRELFGVLESARIRAEGGPIHVHHLPAELRDASDLRYVANPDAPEHVTIEEALRQSGGRKAEAARMLGMGRTTLWRKMKRYGIEDVES